MNTPCEIQILSSANLGPLTFYQLRVPPTRPFECISSREALATQSITVTELSETGSVNALLVTNNSPQFVFFLDGDILHGAKQNRVLNTSVLVQSNSQCRLPVSCVEAGRWRYTSKTFTSSAYASPSSLRGAKARAVRESLETSGAFLCDQIEVWQYVAFMHAKAGTSSPTSNLSDVYEARHDQIEKISSAFSPRPDATALAIFHGEQLLSLDLFNNPGLFASYLRQLVSGAAMEFIMEPELPSPANPSRDIQAAIECFADPQARTFPAVAAGFEKRSENQAATAFALLMPENTTIHAAWLRKNSLAR